MAEERGVTIIGDRMDARLERLEQGQQAIRETMARLEGSFEQMDKRMSSMEAAIGDLRKDVRQVLFVVIVSIAVPILLELIKKVLH